MPTTPGEVSQGMPRAGASEASTATMDVLRKAAVREAQSAAWLQEALTMERRERRAAEQQLHEARAELQRVSQVVGILETRSPGLSHHVSGGMCCTPGRDSVETGVTRSPSGDIDASVETSSPDDTDLAAVHRNESGIKALYANPAYSNASSRSAGSIP